MVSLSPIAHASRFKIRLQPKNTPEKVLLGDLRRVSRQTGDRSPSTTTYDAHGNFSSQVFGQRFGSWNAALAQRDSASASLAKSARPTCLKTSSGCGAASAGNLSVPI